MFLYLFQIVNIFLNFLEIYEFFLSDIRRILYFPALHYLSTSCSHCSRRVTVSWKPGISTRTNSQHSVAEEATFLLVGDSWTSKSHSMIFGSKPLRITDTCLCSWDCGRGGVRMDLFMPTNLPNEFSSAVWNFVDFIIGSFIFQPTISKPRAKTAHWVIIS